MSSYSYQSLETRLRTVEEKLDWFLNQFKVQKMTQLGVLDEAGRPAVKVEQQTLAEVYRDIKNGSIEKVEGVGVSAGE